MTKIVDITGSLVGDDVTCLNIYHSTVCDTNLLCRNASVAGVQSGVRVCSVPDSAFTFFFQDATYTSTLSCFSLPKPTITAASSPLGYINSNILVTNGTEVGITGSGLFGATQVLFNDVCSCFAITSCFDAPTTNTLLDSCVNNCYPEDKTLRIVVANPSGAGTAPIFAEYKTVKTLNVLNGTVLGLYHRYGSESDAINDVNRIEEDLRIYTLLGNSLTEILLNTEGFNDLLLYSNSSLTSLLSTGYYKIVKNDYPEGGIDTNKVFQVTSGILVGQV